MPDKVLEKCKAALIYHVLLIYRDPAVNFVCTLAPTITRKLSIPSHKRYWPKNTSFSAKKTSFSAKDFLKGVCQLGNVQYFQIAKSLFHQ